MNSSYTTITWISAAVAWAGSVLKQALCQQWALASLHALARIADAGLLHGTNFGIVMLLTATHSLRGSGAQ
jgi:hypothetical protein